MRSLTPAIILSLLTVNLASPISSASKSNIVTTIHRRQAQQVSNGKALYFITNDQGQNSVVAIAINQDGTLGDATLTPTSGQGSIAVDADGKPATPDALVGQSALTLSGNNIFAVNAGSNTVSMLSIAANDPCALSIVGQPAALPGTFPNTVSASAKNALVCVGMTGSQAGISCANFDEQNGIAQFDGLRAFDLGQSDPPVGPTNTVSQTFFSEDESMLFTTVKGDPAVNKTGFLSVFPVASGGNAVQRRNQGRSGNGKGNRNGNGNGKGKGKTNACTEEAGGAVGAKLATQDVRSSPAGTAVLFGSQPIPGANPPQIFATDASFGAGILTLDNSSSATLTANQSIADQKATCWATISSVTNSAFVTDVGVNRIVEMSLQDASILGEIDLRKEEASAVDPGLIDLKAAGGFVYALSPGNGTSEAAISVVDVQTKKLVQHAKLGAIGAASTAMGMAILV